MSTTPDDDFIPVAALDDLERNEPRHVIANGRHAVVARLDDDRVVAFDMVCPHAMGNLTEGLIVRGQVICPMHHYRYDLVTGECAWPRGEGGRLARYAVEIRAGQVCVRIPKPAWW